MDVLLCFLPLPDTIFENTEENLSLLLLKMLVKALASVAQLVGTSSNNPKVVVLIPVRAHA